MGKIIIPRRFKEKLSAGSFVYTLSMNVDCILDLPMQYFKEYTLHDENHINAILKIADALVPNDTLSQLSETAIEILVSAIIIHDLGMFIQKDGVQSLLFGKYNNLKTENLDFLCWGEQWQDFYRSARKYNHQQLVDLFGDDPPGIKLPLDTVDDTGESWRVYGEFLRKFHPRLAHDIVLFGFFGATNNDIFSNCTNKNIDFIKNMIGLVARSHGMNIRDTYKYLENHRLLRKETAHLPMGVPIYYLMSVLRLADYLHAGTNRATIARVRAGGIVSSVSKNEFQWNQAVYNECVFFIGCENRNPDEGNFGEYRGYVQITADPESPAIFLSLENWINSIQQELDVCWAILSEKYGADYKLSIHRIVTNIFDDSSLSMYNKKFLTKKAAISANPEIAKLLVAPLYGDNPTFGVRELIQNAVDACNERNEWERRHGRKPTLGKIKIEIDTKQKTFRISDNGIGMNSEVLLNYFLVAGSSFRDSNVWHECNKDDNNKTVTIRSGRFGIGALATFLLGDISTVITRHIADEDKLGYSFSYDITSSKPLDVMRVENVEPGTEIIIPLKQRAVEFFDDIYSSSYGREWYNWYHFSKPEILITLNGFNYFGDVPLKPRFFVPSVKRDNSGWFYCASREYTSIHWGYQVSREDMSILLCNGITVHDVGKRYRNEAVDPFVAESNLGINLRLPEISIVDKEGNLGLDISRSNVTYFKLEDKFGEELCKYWLAQILICQPTDRNGINERIMYGYNTIVTPDKKAFTIGSRTFLFHTGMDILIAGYTSRFTTPRFDSSEKLRNTLIVYKELSKYTLSQGLEFDEQILLDNRGIRSSCKELWVRKIEGIQPYWSDELEKKKIPLGERLKYLNIDSNKYYLGTSNLPFPRRSPIILSDEVPIVIRYKPELPIIENKNLMLKVLRKYIPSEVYQGLIPIDINKRMDMYPKAFDELAKYMIMKPNN